MADHSSGVIYSLSIISNKIEIINEKGKVVYTADNVAIADEKLRTTISTEKLDTGMYDVNVTYQPDSVNPLYGPTEVLFEDAFKFEVGIIGRKFSGFIRRNIK